MNRPGQLISYIAPAAPATLRPATGAEPRVRAEIGFTPRWYREHLAIDFGEQWHTDPAYRRDSVVAMRKLLRQRFPRTSIGGIDRPDRPLDLLTGTFGGLTVAAIYGVPLVYFADNWPCAAHAYLSDVQVDALEPPDLDDNAFFQQLLEQVDWIAGEEGSATGYINWQGVLNNAHRLRGQALLMDLIESPDRCRHLFDCVCRTMIAAVRCLHERQQQSGHVDPLNFVTISNCLVNMVSPELYRELLLPFDRRLAEAFDAIGVHNCAWKADPYLEAYASLPHVAYVDMSHESDLARAKSLFPSARRAIMYTPMDLETHSIQAIEDDFQSIAQSYAPCDIVLADIEDTTPDSRVLQALEICRRLSEGNGDA